jgi:hypothetical protein
MRVDCEKCQRKLVVLWLVMAAVPFSIMAVQTLLEKYGSKNQEAWGWLLPTVIPTLLLVVGTVVTVAFNADFKGPRTVDVFYYKLASRISIFYLSFVVVILIVASMRSTPVAIMSQSNIFLGPLQGLVGAALGVFFVSAEQRAVVPVTTSPAPVIGEPG